VTITLTHSNDGKKIDFIKSQIFYIRPAADGSTWVVSCGGAYAPVRESVDEVKRLLSAGNDSQPVTKE
jgi:hypothetical protein